MTDGMLEEHEAEEGIRLSTDRVIASQHRTLERLIDPRRRGFFAARRSR